MLVFSAILPHAAILLPTVGKENLKKLNKTIDALAKIKEDFDAAKPDSIIIISSHEATENHFALCINKEYFSDFEKLGDFVTKLHFQPDFLTLSNLREAIRNKGMPLALKSNEKLDYDVTLPLFYLGDSQKIVPFMVADLPLKKHLEVGAVIKEVVSKSEKRFAVIASTTLSHALETDAPAGFSPLGKEFDEKMQEFIVSKNAAGLVLYDEVKLREAKECASRQIAVLFGILQQIDFTPQIYSYEAPFGVGFLVANFKI